MLRWLAAFAVHLATATGGSAHAQAGNGCPPASGEPYTLCQVDVAPRPDLANPPPRYPAMLLQANVSGVVRVAFVIDSAGRILTPSLRVLHARHDLFAMSVKNALRSWQFTPAEEANRRVAVNYEYEFVFTVPLDSIYPAELIAARRDTTGTVPRMQIGAGEPDAAAAMFTRAELLAAQRSALDGLSPRPPTIDGRVRTITLCLTLLEGGAPLLADDATIRALELPNRRVVTPTQCPRTYASMIYNPRLSGPKGYIDPYIMRVERVVPWNANAVSVDIEVTHGLATSGERCVVMRDAGAWRASCRTYRRANFS